MSWLGWAVLVTVLSIVGDPVGAARARQKRTRTVMLEYRQVTRVAAEAATADGRSVIDGDRLRADFGFVTVRVLNDFEALAWSPPHLGPADLLRVGDGNAHPGAPMIVLGPGTGLGAACLMPRPGGAIAISSEAGHATLPGASRREDRIIERLRQRFGCRRDQLTSCVAK